MLPFSVSLRAGAPVHEQVVYAVTRAVVIGQLRPGDAFPSVRALSQELGINPNTAHKIVAALTAEGVLAVRPGVGTVVSEPRRVARADRDAIEDNVEKLVTHASRAGLTVQDLLAMVRRQWAKTIRRAG
jgi:GntR family transcriptional regulator